MSVKRFRGIQLLAFVLLAGSTSELVLAQSAGKRLVRRELLNHRFEATTELDLYEEPERVPFIPILWQTTERTGDTISAGERVRVVGVKESSIGLRRFVWLEVETEPQSQFATRPPAAEPPSAPGDSPDREHAENEREEGSTVRGWLRLGSQHWAMSAARELLTPVPEEPPQEVERQ